MGFRDNFLAVGDFEFRAALQRKNVAAVVGVMPVREKARRDTHDVGARGFLLSGLLCAFMTLHGRGEFQLHPFDVSESVGAGEDARQGIAGLFLSSHGGQTTILTGEKDYRDRKSQKNESQDGGFHDLLLFTQNFCADDSRFSCEFTGARLVMSFDLGVWYPQQRIRNEEATELYVRLCDGDTSGVLPHPAIDAFYAELTAKHPEIDTIPKEKIDDHDYCPWSCKLDYSPSHVIMSYVWSKATHVHQFVQALAREHGLALYDPQSEEVIYPDGSKCAKANTSRTSLWILGVFALLFAAMFVYSGQDSTSREPVVFYVFAALCVLMAVLCFRQARK
jgi:hypothetical protein